MNIYTNLTEIVTNPADTHCLDRLRNKPWTQNNIGESVPSYSRLGPGPDRACVCGACAHVHVSVHVSLCVWKGVRVRVCVVVEMCMGLHVVSSCVVCLVDVDVTLGWHARAQNCQTSGIATAKLCVKGGGRGGTVVACPSAQTPRARCPRRSRCPR